MDLPTSIRLNMVVWHTIQVQYLPRDTIIVADYDTDEVRRHGRRGGKGDETAAGLLGHRRHVGEHLHLRHRTQH